MTPPHNSQTEAITNLQPTTQNLRPRLHPIYYDETRFKNEAGLANVKCFETTSTLSGGITFWFLSKELGKQPVTLL